MTSHRGPSGAGRYRRFGGVRARSRPEGLRLVASQVADGAVAPGRRGAQAEGGRPVDEDSRPTASRRWLIGLATACERRTWTSTSRRPAGGWRPTAEASARASSTLCVVRQPSATLRPSPLTSRLVPSARAFIVSLRSSTRTSWQLAPLTGGGVTWRASTGPTECAQVRDEWPTRNSERRVEPGCRRCVPR